MLALADSIEAADGAPPLSDQGRTQLGSDHVRHLVATDDAGVLVGYAQLDDRAAELLGEPIALAPLLDALLARSNDQSDPILLWAHGKRGRLRPVLDQRGYAQIRALWQLRWPVGELPPVSLPDGVRLRPLVRGEDEDALLAVNAAAFAHHPEQGGWTRADVAAREAEPWFDPADLLLAVNADGELLGFHWTKRHSASLGEVYVMAVAPAAQGMHLGSALLLAGLAHLRDIGLDEVLLYVDESNVTAVALYQKYGFRPYESDAQYRLGG